MSIFFGICLPLFIGGAVLGASVMWCVCKRIVRDYAKK